MAERPPKDAARTRWQLVLGRYAERRLGAGLSGADARRGRALDYLYGREHAAQGAAGARGSGGSLDPTALSVPRWLGELRDLFPRDVVTRIEQHALERYQLEALLKDPDALKSVEPNLELVPTLLAFKDRATPAVKGEIERLVRTVVEELTKRLSAEVRQAFGGRIDRFRRSQLKVAQNFDWRRTVRANLKHWDPERQRLVLEDLRFFSRVRRELPWTIVLCVDQSGSMAPSLIYAAVMAGIFSGLPAIKVHLVLFDTSVVDLSERVDDPVGVLLNVQLGGGTNIGQALRYCAGLVEDPRRTVLILLSDFEEGASPRALLATCARLAADGVRLLGLAALDEAGAPLYDHRMAEELTAVGMKVAVLTPKELAGWLAEVIR